MDRETAKETIKREWRTLILGMTSPAKQRVNGETSYICPLCGHGAHGDGLTINRKSADGTGLKCFGCGFSGDIIALYQAKTGADYNTAFSILADELNLTIDSNTPQEAVKRPYSDFTGSDKETDTTERKTPAGAADTPTGAGADYTAYYKECAERITDPAAAAYLQGRGISQKTAQAYYLGFDPQADPANAPGGRGERRHPAARLIIPTTAAHYVARAINGETPAQYQKINPKDSTPGIFNEQALYTQDVQEVFITEGVFDALSVIEAGAAAVALNSAANADLFIQRIEKKPTAATLILCLDNDERGQAAAEIIAQGAQRLNTRYIKADIAGIYKDPNERLQQDRAGFIEAVQAAAEAAAPETGASMIDSFLKAIYTEKYKPVSTGIKGLDRLLHGGFIPQTLVLLGAEPGAGKTALATMIFEHMAQTGQPGIYFNLEMSSEQLIARSIARIAYLNNNWKMDALDVLQGYRQDKETRAVVEQAAGIYKETIAENLQYNPGDNGADVTKILSYINAAGKAAQEAGRPAPNIAIDYLQLLQGDGREDAAEIIKRAVKGFKDYAVKYNAIVLCIMAQSRAVNNLKEATLSAGRDTSATEYTADVQLQLIRGNEGDENEITLHITKSRFTQTNMKKGAHFHFRGAQSYFEEFDECKQSDGKNPFEDIPLR